MADFIQEYFINPIIYPNSYAPYNVYNTTAYAIIAIIAVYALYKIFKKTGVEINESFFKAILPFVVFGSALRISEDAGVTPRVVEIWGVKLFPFVTPGIYVLTFILLAFAMTAARIAYGTGEKFYRAVMAFGVALAVASAITSAPTLSQMQNPLAFAAIAIAAAAILIAFSWFRKKQGLQASFQEKSTVFAQALDGSATFVGVSFLGYSEQHIVGNAIFDLFGGPWAFLAVKIVFALVVVELVRRENIKQDEKNYVLLLITILGLGPGLRDSFRILAGV
ncbi:MAG: DUF63 family protein [Candidatus Norongarragalinales archaeon]